MDTIQCPHCKANGIPHLWHYKPWLHYFFYMKTQHMCRLCGEVMYETGGQINILGYLVIAALIDVFYGALHLGMPAWWLWKILDPLLNWLLYGFIAYRIYRYFSPKAR